MSFLARTSWVMLLAAVLPLALVGASGMWWYEQLLIDRTLAHLQSVAALQRARIRDVVDHNLERFALVASRTALRVTLDRHNHGAGPQASARMTRILSDALLSIPVFERVTIVSPDGDTVVSIDNGRSPELADLAPATDLAATDSTPSFRLARAASGAVKVLLTGPLVLEERRVGTMVLQLNSADVAAIVDNYDGLGSSGETLLGRATQTGAILLMPTRFDPTAGFTRHLRNDGPSSVPMIRALAGVRGTASERRDYRGVAVLSATEYLPELKWGVVAKIDRAEVMSTLASAKTVAAFVLIATCLMVLMVMLSVSRSIRNPIRALLVGANDVGHGRLGAPVRVPPGTEFSELAGAFNKMMSNLSASMVATESEAHERMRMEQRYRQIIESAPTAMVLCDVRGDIALVNRATEELFGYTRDELEGKSVETLLPERFAARHPQHRRKYMSAPASRSMGAGRNLMGLHKDGSEVPIEIGLNPIETETGTMILSAIVDITERRRFESDLIDRNRRLEQQDWLKTGQTDIAKVLRHCTRVEEVAASALMFYYKQLRAVAGALYVRNSDDEFVLRAGIGLPDSGVAQRFDLGALAPGQAIVDGQPLILSKIPQGHLAIQTGLGTSDPRSIAIAPFQHGDHTNAVLELASLGEYDDSDMELFAATAPAVAAALDVASSSERLEQLLEESREKSEALERANEYKSAFLANMSHELRTPLNSLLILARDLASDAGGTMDAEQRKAAAIIERSGKNLLALINDILDMSRIEAGVIEISPVHCSVTRSVAEMREQFEPLARESGLTFTTAVDEQVPPTFCTDWQRVTQVICNLLGNAFKFTEHGEVRLCVAHLPGKAERLEIAVADTGIGIPADECERIFGAFNQVDGARTRQHGGTGLGLSISAQLADLLGGDISLESKVGVGSTFTLRIPRLQAAADAVAATPSMPMASSVRASSSAPASAASLPDASTPGFAHVAASGPSSGAAATTPAAKGNGWPCVMVVHDSMREAFVASSALSAAGAEVRIARTVDRALEMLDEHVDLLVAATPAMVAPLHDAVGSWYASAARPGVCAIALASGEAAWHWPGTVEVLPANLSDAQLRAAVPAGRCRLTGVA